MDRAAFERRPAADWPVIAVTRELALCITGEMPALDAALEDAVERHWQAVRRDRPLFNGRVFCADRIGPDRIDGHWTEYRRAVAQMEDPALIPALGIRSLAVCGVICCADGGVAVGRREARSVYQAGLWQLPPAGSVDHGVATPGGADWRLALLTELREEMGVPAAAVTGLSPLCLVQHPSGVLDLGVRIDTALTGEAVLAAHRASGNGEYERMLVVPAAEVAGAVAALGGELVPPAHAFLRAVLHGPSS